MTERPMIHLPRLVLVACISLASTAPALAAEFDCLMEPRQTVDVRPAVEGLIEQVLVDRGDRIRAGQTLVVLDTSVERSALEQARFRASAVGALRSAESRVEYAKVKLSRREQLADQNFISTQERDEARAEKSLAEAELTQARENRRAAELEMQRAEVQLRLRTLKSPFNGVVTDRLMHPGDLADNSDLRKPLLKIADTSVLNVEVLLPADAFGLVQTGTSVQVSPDAPVGGRYAATVKAVDPVMDSASSTFRVRLELPNPALKLPAGFACRADFPQIKQIGSGLTGRPISPRPQLPAAAAR